REFASFVYAEEIAQPLLFGGNKGTRDPVNTLWTFSESNNRWQEITDVSEPGGSPLARYSAATTWDSNNNQLLISKGRGEDGQLNDLWALGFGQSATLLSVPVSAADLPFGVIMNALQLRIDLSASATCLANQDGAKVLLWETSRGWTEATKTGTTEGFTTLNIEINEQKQLRRLFGGADMSVKIAILTPDANTPCSESDASVSLDYFESTLLYSVPALAIP
ncbi:hypothetical protein KAI87_05905, partial [Myxococcota bacterium]|nr:hypothetical protein [Myxococcota bacterium]